MFRVSVPRLVVLAAPLVLGSGGCAPRVIPAAGPVAGPTSPAAVPSAQTADVRLARLSGEATARVGQTIGVTAPGGEWQVDFDAESLQLLSPPAELAAPGTRGWVWRARKAGRTDIVFTARARCDTPPCPPNVAQFTLSIDVTPATVFVLPGGFNVH